MTADARARHVLGISGGRDSAALAIYMRDRVPEMEYFFCDTGSELPETYEYLQRLEAVLGKRIVRLNPEKNFDHWLWIYQGTLPSPQMRWCTKMLKIKPLEAWIGEDQAITYIAIRADEKREGYISHKPNIAARFPFKEDGIDKEGVLRILEDGGVGLPSYYEWRTRSGCYFCFFQRKSEWVGLQERHADLFERAVEYEDKVSFERSAMEARQYTWSGKESLRELIARKEEIKARAESRASRSDRPGSDGRLIKLLPMLAADEEDDEAGCLICHL
jgi:Phosphoadenosine phosphosulfate reductase family